MEKIVQTSLSIIPQNRLPPQRAELSKIWIYLAFSAHFYYNEIEENFFAQEAEDGAGLFQIFL